MEVYNKYGDISGGYIADFIDRKCHEIAIDLIGECKTSNIKIDYLKPTNKITELNNMKIFTYMVGNNKAYFQIDIGNKIFGSLLFIKIRVGDTEI